jgi:PAS domain S-box-containing protein
MTNPIPVSATQLQMPAFLSRPGGMSERIRQFDWSGTSLGAVDTWKQSLRSALSICLNSNFPIGIYWGKDLVLLYNDAWSPIPGNKHPWALGRPAKEVWPEIWDAIEPQFEKAFSGEPGGSKDALLLMQRHGYTEECYFDFTFTPVYGEDGHVDGIFNAVIETTYRLINERRTQFLQRLSRKINPSSTSEEVFKKASLLIKANPADIPFCFFYTMKDGEVPKLDVVTALGIPVKGLPFDEVIKNGSPQHLKELHRFLDKIPVNFWPDLPSEALLVPLTANNGEITGFVFAGLSARRQFDHEYQVFIQGFATVISRTLNNIHSLEEERTRSEILNQAKKNLEDSEAAFRLANQQLELTFRNVPSAIYLLDQDGKILLMNNQAGSTAQMSDGTPPQQPVDLEWLYRRTSEIYTVLNESGELISMEELPVKETLRTAMSSEKIIHLIRKSDGNHRWIIVNSSPLLDESGNLKMVLATSTDITIQKQAEEKIRESEEHFRSLTQALPQLLWVTDAKGNQEFVTERWKEYTGMDPLDAQTWSQMIHPEDAGSINENWSHSMATGTTYKAEVRLKGKNGNYRWFHVHGEPIRNEKNEIIKWVGAFTDINEQKFAEELLRQSEERLEFLVKKRTEELERSNEDLQQFAHVASHDLKEPIRKIKIFSGMLEDEFNEQINPEGMAYLSKIQNASDRMITMMDAVLRYAGLDGYLQKIEMISLNKTLESIETDLENVITKKKAIIERDILPDIQGYPVLIYQLFYNLISNALKFSNPQVVPRIQIRHAHIKISNREFAEFRIIDNGIGFEEEDAEKIFQTFTRLNAKEEYEGTGLGLSLCRKITIRHNGNITAHAKPGIGAEFKLNLPVHFPDQ